VVSRAGLLQVTLYLGVVNLSIGFVQALLTPMVLSFTTADRLGLALETMGGASGQTLAGAVSTGTHGGDKFLPPLADSVLALHLVGPGGDQYWVEPSEGITDPTLLRMEVAPEVAAEHVVYDDATFNACLVSLGCLGVVYAVVLGVRDAYDLVETTTTTTWREFKQDPGVFLDDRENRFLQVIVSPYPDAAGDNLCLVTTRSDCYTAYIQVQGWRDAGTADATMVSQKRLAFIVDRSRIYGNKRNPTVYNVPVAE